MAARRYWAWSTYSRKIRWPKPPRSVRLRSVMPLKVKRPSLRSSATARGCWLGSRMSAWCAWKESIASPAVQGGDARFGSATASRKESGGHRQASTGLSRRARVPGLGQGCRRPGRQGAAAGNEWELPGGKLELGEDPLDCVVREIGEETGWQVKAGPLLDCWQYHIREGSDVVIVTYGCHVLSSDPPAVSNEHKRAGLFTPGQVPELVMPDGYKRSVAAWVARLYEQPVP